MTATIDDLFALPVTVTDNALTVFRVGGMYVCDTAAGRCSRTFHKYTRRRIVAVVDAIRTGKRGNLLDLTIHDQIDCADGVRRFTSTKRGVRCLPCAHTGMWQTTVFIDRNTTSRGWWLDSSRMVAVGG